MAIAGVVFRSPLCGGVQSTLASRWPGRIRPGTRRKILKAIHCLLRLTFGFKKVAQAIVLEAFIRSKDSALL